MKEQIENYIIEFGGSEKVADMTLVYMEILLNLYGEDMEISNEKCINGMRRLPNFIFQEFRIMSMEEDSDRKDVLAAGILCGLLIKDIFDKRKTSYDERFKLLYYFDSFRKELPYLEMLIS